MFFCFTAYWDETVAVLLDTVAKAHAELGITFEFINIGERGRASSTRRHDASVARADTRRNFYRPAHDYRTTRSAHRHRLFIVLTIIIITQAAVWASLTGQARR